MFIKNKMLYYFQKLQFIYNFLFSYGFKENKLYSELLADSGNVVDVGSNVGSFVNTISSLAKKKNLNIYAFEPNMDLYNLDLRILKSPNHTLKVNNLAISSKIGKEIYFNSSISSQSTFRKDNIKLGKIIDEQLVDCITLDFYCSQNNIDYIDLLKIDVEGMEIEVLKSAQQLLRDKRVKIIKIEFSTDNLYEGFSILSNFDYAYIGSNNQTYVKNRLELADYFFVKN
jgi:FkbM family methyltransferase